jgi:hypothetical protein
MRTLPAEASARLLDRLPHERLRVLVGTTRHWEAIARYLDAGELADLRGRLEGGDHAA